MFGRQCETCERKLSAFATRIRNPITGAKECEDCARTASLHGEFVAYLNEIDPGLGDLWAANGPDGGEYEDRFYALPLTVRNDILATAQDMEIMLYGTTSSLQTVAHDAGDGETIYHCPFCGSGNVVARSDGSAECGHCNTVFTVQVQPQHPYTPQTVNGMPYNNPELPGQVTDPAAEGTQPGAPPENEPVPGQESLVFVPPSMGEPLDPNLMQPPQQVAASKTAGRWSENDDHWKWSLNEHPYTAMVYSQGEWRRPTGYHYNASKATDVAMEWTTLTEGVSRTRGEGQQACEQAIAADKKVASKLAAIHGVRNGQYLGVFNVYADAQAADCDRVFSTKAWEFDGSRFVNRKDGEIVPLDDYESIYGGDYGEQVAASKQYYLTAAGDPLDEVSFLRHVAIMHAEDVDARTAVLTQVRAERG